MHRYRVHFIRRLLAHGKQVLLKVELECKVKAREPQGKADGLSRVAMKREETGD
jgi:hypothetical protein